MSYADGNYKQIDWWGLYRERWTAGETLTQQAFCHPAKVAPALARKIYQHALEEGWLKEGSLVVDPFWGVGGFGLSALLNGINIIGCEIEPKFFTLSVGGDCNGEVGQQDISKDKHEGWYVLFEDEEGDTQIMGKSGETSPISEIAEDGYETEEKLGAVIKVDRWGMDGFADVKNLRVEYRKFGERIWVKPALCGKREKHESHHVLGNLELWDRKYRGKMPKYGSARVVLGDSRYLVKVLRENGIIASAEGALSSPPYEPDGLGHHGGFSEVDAQKALHARMNNAQYGQVDGNLGNMENGNVDSAISSPPYEGALAPEYCENPGGGLAGRNADQVEAQDWRVSARYGTSEGQLAEMPVDAALGSPPFLQTSGGTNVTSQSGVLSDPALINRHSAGNAAAHGYGETPGQIEKMPEGNLDAAVSSPPFGGQSADGGWQMLGKYAEKGQLTVKQVGGDPNKSYPSWDKERDTSYGHAEGQLADSEMKDEGLDAAISSPPYSTQQVEGGDQAANPSFKWVDGERTDRGKINPANFRGINYGKEQGQMGNMDAAITSPAYGDISQSGGTAGLKEHGTGLTGGERFFTEYGEQGGQLGRKPVSEDGLDAALSSPPYAGARIDGRGDEGSSNLRDENGEFLRGEEGWEARKAMGDRYGEQDGQLGAMAEGEVADAVTSSPPFEDSLSNDPSKKLLRQDFKMGASSMGQGYGEQLEGNIGEQSGDDFWMASRKILENLFYLIKPGGKAIFVLKRYVKDRQIVEFPTKWVRLCEAVGFELDEWIKAWVVEDRGAQYDLFGNLVEKRVKRASFFRLLAEKKGAPPIDWEDVVVLTKPSQRLTQGGQGV